MAICITISNVCSAQVIKSKIIDNGGSGPYKAIAATEKTLPDFVVYRPENIETTAKKEGKLPLLVFANGGCSNTSITHEKVLSEIASHGYIVIAIGALQMTLQDRKPEQTQATMLTDAIDWMTSQNSKKGSEYYENVDLNKVASGGQSCGGAQILVVAGDPRIKTSMMFNSGMGNMTMAGASTESLKSLHSPIIYIIGGESDVAYPNAIVDYDRIDKVPVAFANLLEGGHMGTFGEEFGGSFSKMALDWLDWQLKGKKEKSTVFLIGDLSAFPGWTMKSKNFN
jgi:hypothetical protein